MFKIIKKNLINERGFSLTELMVVIVIIGLLALIAIPRFLTVTSKAKMTEAKIMLKQVYTLQQAYYYENDAYSNDLSAIGFEQNKLITEGGNARYIITIEKATPTEFIARATAVVDFNKNGIFNAWEVNQEGVIKQIIAD
jgi:type IV pilus assembly protein PilE